MDVIQQWKAKRSGGRITITGQDGRGAAVKVANVDTIEARPQASSVPSCVIVATDKNGAEYRLSAPNGH